MPEQQSPADYKSCRIVVNGGGYFPGTRPPEWIFSIYRESDGTLVYDKGVSKSDAAAHSVAREWIDEHPITKG